MEPGQSQTYAWLAPPTLGPGKQDFSTVAYTYRSTVDPTAHENAGLIGAVVIGRAVRSSLGAPCICRHTQSRALRSNIHLSVLVSARTCAPCRTLLLACQDSCARM